MWKRSLIFSATKNVGVVNPHVMFNQRQSTPFRTLTIKPNKQLNFGLAQRYHNWNKKMKFSQVLGPRSDGAMRCCTSRFVVVLGLRAPTMSQPSCKRCPLHIGGKKCWLISSATLHLGFASRTFSFPILQMPGSSTGKISKESPAINSPTFL